MCLKVYCDGDSGLFDKLKHHAQKLGSAFQKVHFLRDLKHDINNLGRSYFPEISNSTVNQHSKILIEESIKKDFDEVMLGIKQLPGRSKLAVVLALYNRKDYF